MFGFNSKNKPTRIYLDYASTTPVDSRVFQKMKPYFSVDFGNPSALYQEGIIAKKAVAEARSTIAKLLNARSEEIIFTASGTEADNLAIAGLAKAERLNYLHTKLHIITSVIEHPAILEVCKELERWGFDVTYIPVGEDGLVDPKKVAAALRPETMLVSIMYANNEIGTIQPIKEISRAVKKFRENLQKKITTGTEGSHGSENAALRNSRWPFIHTDASQAAGYFSCAVDSLGVDLLTLDASKIYGPKGIGALYMKKGTEITPIIVGGGQENGRRAATENVAGIVGFAEAFAIAQTEREAESARLTEMRDYFITEFLKMVPHAHLNGDPKERMPNNINVCIQGLNAEFAVIQLDEKGIACASVSSCKNLSESSSSYVIEALKKDGKIGEGCGESSLRFSLGRFTTKKEIDVVLKVISQMKILQKTA